MKTLSGVVALIGVIVMALGGVLLFLGHRDVSFFSVLIGAILSVHSSVLRLEDKIDG